MGRRLEGGDLESESELLLPSAFWLAVRRTGEEVGKEGKLKVPPPLPTAIKTRPKKRVLCQDDGGARTE